MNRRRALLLGLVLCLLPAVLAAQSFADSAFESVWQRTDKPVADGRVGRSWVWGPAPFSGAIQEPYAESPGGVRTVQYFDKSRMEINDPNADRGSAWFVTNGLLVREMVDGRIASGNSAYSPAAPSQEAVAGDPAANNPNCPTYATFQYLSWQRAADRSGQAVTAVIARDGSTWDDPSKAGYAGTALAYYESTLGHNVPQAFWAFMNQTGLVYENGAYRTEVVFDWLYAMGYPISEAYWTRALVGGVEKDVLVQLFERRVLSYTPSNPAGWQVEMGNVGQHYYNWRYGAASYNQPGLYTFSDLCTDLRLWNYEAYIHLCVTSVEVRADGSMKLTVLWSAELSSSYPYQSVAIVRDSGHFQWLEDNLGKPYHHTEVGGVAASGANLTDGAAREGWYVFPPPQPGATSFSFVANNLEMRVDGIVLRH